MKGNGAILSFNGVPIPPMSNFDYDTEFDRLTPSTASIAPYEETPQNQYPRVTVTGQKTPCYVCGRKTEFRIEYSAEHQIPCDIDCIWDLGYEADEGAALPVVLRKRPENETL